MPVLAIFCAMWAMVNGSTGAVNPSLTISALAERNIERMIAEDFTE